MSEFSIESAPVATDEAVPAAPEAPAATEAKKSEPIDDVSVMSRIKTLMGKLPKEHQVRVAKWTADRWG